MDRIEKFLRKIGKKRAARLVAVMRLIAHGQLDGLDIVPLQGHENWYRCRVGDIRIIFMRTEEGRHIVLDVNFRGGIYKK